MSESEIKRCCKTFQSGLKALDFNFVCLNFLFERNFAKWFESLGSFNFVRLNFLFEQSLVQSIQSGSRQPAWDV